MKKYRFLSNAAMQPTTEAVKQAKKVTNVDDILNLSANVGAYEFVADDAITKRFRAAKSLEISVETLSSGALVNRAKLTEKDGKTFNLRCYGVKDNLQPAGVVDASKFAYGFCMSDGEKVSTQKYNPSTGEVFDVPVLYVNLA